MKYTDDYIIENVNHTHLVILAVLVAAALVTGMFATGIQQAQAGGRHKYKGSGDSVAFEQENKQKAKCLALVISRADACNQEARNDFNVGVGEGSSTTPPPSSTTPPPTEPECIPANVGGITAVLSDSSCTATLPTTASNTERNAFRTECNAIEGSDVSGNGNTTPLVCTFPAT
jgi:hypothetical protein